MSGASIDFVLGNREARNKKEEDFSLCYAYPIVNEDEPSSVLTTDTVCPRQLKEDFLVEDGLYSSDNLLTDNAIKPHHLNDVKTLEYERRKRFSGVMLEIAVRRVIIHPRKTDPLPAIQIAAVSILFKRKLICKSTSPFDRKLYRLLVRNAECDNLSIQVHTQTGQSNILPLPIPKRCVKDYILDIDFAVNNNAGAIYEGTVTCTVSLSNFGSGRLENTSSYAYKLSNDPNDPQNSLSLLRPRITRKKTRVDYFSLQHPSLKFDVDPNERAPPKKPAGDTKPPDIVVSEQLAFSLLNISFRNIFQAKRPLRPSSSVRRHHTIGRTALSVTILRGVEIPVREESAFVQPFVEVEWCNTVYATAVSDGPAPIWQQTMNFELPRQSGEYCVKLRLFDQHPVWGEQWLGEARIPLEYHRNYQELERWLALSPLFSPVLLFGYVQASPGQSHTRIYVLIKMEQPVNTPTVESSNVNTLLKGIQRCLSTPYKVDGLESPEEVARLAMLLLPLPRHYGPITPRQALSIRKVDHYGRAALLATFLQGFDLEAYVLLVIPHEYNNDVNLLALKGCSQISKWTAFVLSIGENGNHVLWDAEVGCSYRLDDNRCYLMKVYRLINESGIWENLQKSILPHNLKYDTKIGSDWKAIGTFVPSRNRSVQSIELSSTDEDDREAKAMTAEIEDCLKDKLTSWRSTEGLTTVFNRHAISVLRHFLVNAEDFPRRPLDRRDLKQLYRAYHTHGFVLNTRQYSADELCDLLRATKIHKITGSIEFALVCQIQRYVGKISSMWIAAIVLRNRD